MRIHVSQIVEPATAVAVSVTDCPFTPKLALFFGNDLNSIGASAHHMAAFGAAVSTTKRGAAASISLDAQPTSTTDRYQHNTACLVSGNGLSIADFTSFNADGLTVTFSAVQAGAAWSWLVICIGGDDLTVDMTTLTVEAGTGNQSNAALAFQPDCLIAFGAVLATGAASGSILSVGFATATAQFAQCNESDDGEPANQDCGVAYTTTIVQGLATDQAVFQSASLVSMNADGFTWDFTTNGGSGQVYHVVALKSDAGFFVGEIVQKTSTGLQSYSGFGLTPAGVLHMGVGVTAQTTGAGVDATWMMGAATSASNRGAHWAGDLNAALSSICDSVSDRAHAIHLYAVGTPTIVMEADLATLDENGETLDYETADGSARLFAVLAFGSSQAEEIIYTQNESPDVIELIKTAGY